MHCHLHVLPNNDHINKSALDLLIKNYFYIKCFKEDATL